MIFSDSTWNYNFKTFLSAETTSSKNWFHLWQLLRRSSPGGFVLSLGLRSDLIYLSDAERPCGLSCGGIPFASYAGKTIGHEIDISYGSNGTVVYTMTDLTTNTVLLKYSAVGEMGSDSSLKFGAYRLTYPGMRPVTNYVGDYVATRIS